MDERSKKKLSVASVLGSARPEEVLKSSHFESVTINLKIQNELTRTTIEETQEAKTRVLELLSDGLILELPQKTCALGHLLILDIAVTIPEQAQHRFHCTVKVQSAEAIPDSKQEKIKLSFIQFKTREWKALCDYFESRQLEIDTFLSAARGY